MFECVCVFICVCTWIWDVGYVRTPKMERHALARACVSEVSGLRWYVRTGFEGLCRCFGGYLWLKLDR